MVTSAQRHAPATILDDRALGALRARLHGALVLPPDPTYDDLRRIFNARIDRRPAAIVQCADTLDVVVAIDVARRYGLPLTVRGGGHGAAGDSICDDGLMIDLARMKGIDVDPDRRVAVAQPGLRLGEFVTATERYSLVSPTGTVSNVGLSGLTLGAGFGWLNGKHGLTIDNLLGAQVVTADGRVLHASADEHPDLFWALRGGGGNFGVVTSFEFRLHPVTRVLGGALILPFSRAGEVLRFFRETAAAAPDELTLYAAFITLPDGDQAIAITVCWCGALAEGERVLAAIRAFGPPVADLIQPMSYATMNTLVDAATPPGLRNYWRWSSLPELSDGAIEAILVHVGQVPSPRTVVQIEHHHGAARRIAPTATAYPHRDAPHGTVILSTWDDPADDERNIQWTRDLVAAMRPYTTGGVYVNEAQDEEPRAAFGVNYDRLVEVKNRYDPTNVFRHNTNIAPTTGA